MSASHKELLAQLELKLGYKFKSEDLLLASVTHKSFANENIEVTEDNQRLEFLGDAVLGLVVAEALMEKLPQASEGELTPRRAALVNEVGLAALARRFDLGLFLRLGKGEEKNEGRGRPSILADAVESVIGAVYLDGGYDSARDVVSTLLADGLDRVVGGRPPSESKTVLQEMLQAQNKPAPEYRVANEEGPDHEKLFHVEILEEGRVLAKGQGRSKKEAEKAAATAALKSMEEE